MKAHFYKWLKYSGLMTAVALPVLVLFYWGGVANKVHTTLKPRFSPDIPPVFVKSQGCMTCHPKEYQLWKQSHHYRSMLPANGFSVLGDFNNKQFVHGNKNSRFFRVKDKYFVATEGDNGRIKNFEILFTFGFKPLQQYLIKMSDGRLQALDIAWNDEQKKWYSLQSETVNSNHWLHWTKGAYNWNSRCANCHSTDVQKKYDASSKQYKTTYSEINVACEACHGAGSNHVKWQNYVKKYPQAKNQLEYSGFFIRLKHSESGKLGEVDRCAGCHSRSNQLVETYDPAKRFTDQYDLQLLDEQIYYPDGQILEENYVYGSFLQSKMFHKGIHCTNCHDPHSYQLKKEGNTLCTSCHQHPKEKYDTPAHTHHPVNSAGGACINCHMDGKNYMGIDYRRDHSFRIPRPDFSLSSSAPNACNQCHHESAQWANDQLKKWLGRLPTTHFNETMIAINKGATLNSISELIKDPSVPEIVRASALSRLTHRNPRFASQLSKQLLNNEQSLIRKVAVKGLLSITSATEKIQLLMPRLSDKSAAVQFETVKALADYPDSLLPEKMRKVRAQVEKAYLDYLERNSDSPTVLTDKGVFYQKKGQWQQAKKSYLEALDIHPKYTLARYKLALLFSFLGEHDNAKRTLHKLIREDPGFSEAHYALGLLYAEEGQINKAVDSLKISIETKGTNPRAYYNLAILYQSRKENDKAQELLEKLCVLEPSEEFLYALAFHYYQSGQKKASLTTVMKILTMNPSSKQAHLLLEQLKSSHSN